MSRKNCKFTQKCETQQKFKIWPPVFTFSPLPVFPHTPVSFRVLSKQQGMMQVFPQGHNVE